MNIIQCLGLSLGWLLAFLLAFVCDYQIKKLKAVNAQNRVLLVELDNTRNELIGCVASIEHCELMFEDCRKDD